MTDTPEPERWTTDDVAAYLKLSTRAAARAQLAVWGITAVGRQPGRRGLNLYEPAEVKARHLGRLGRGYRTDKHPKS